MALLGALPWLCATFLGFATHVSAILARHCAAILWKQLNILDVHLLGGMRAGQHTSLDGCSTKTDYGDAGILLCAGYNRKAKITAHAIEPPVKHGNRT